MPTNIGQAVSSLGLGRLGKTQFAVEYAYKFQSGCPNGVIWLTVDQDVEAQIKYSIFQKRISNVE